MTSRFGKVPGEIRFPEEEEKTLEGWRKIDAFRKSVKLSEGRPRFSFYDGPPFATGLPHYGHILAGTIKDIVPRWAHQTGHYVERRFGWDTHGLPIEFEIDKEYGINSPQEVLDIGIAEYNSRCRKIVLRYAGEWRTTIERMGRWVDFDNDYKTMDPNFMESVWWVFSELFKKDLVYRGVKVMPYSTGCNTPLSNFEAGQNYKDVIDPAAFVAFELVKQPNRYLVIWTTTPWTLPSNLAIAVHPELDYVVVRCNKTSKELIVMKQRLSELFSKPKEYTVVEEFKGVTLKDLEYKPVFPYFESFRESNGAFRVVMGDFITTDQGTGVVHQAPYFGEIDYNTCRANGIIQKDSRLVCPLDASGKFTSEVPDFEGKYVKDADKDILKTLSNSGHLVKQTQVKHSYPFCWRSDTPLLYMAVPSWFIKVEQLIPKLLANNEKTYWVPAFVQEKRFGNWLKDARDWAVSRNRFWGTPINLWVSDDLEEVICVGSIAELEELSGQKVTDLHREHVDQLIIKSPKTGRLLKRVSEVFDCWFESGSMPYGQQHYPFENRQHFEESFPADFVSEGIDQTRGWFYTLLVLGTALFDRPPFKNLIASGLILASDGEKMSKRKKNYPDPVEIVNKYGADALRLYLINSPVLRGENLRFREEGVKQVLMDVMLPWFNAFRFLFDNIVTYEKETGKEIDLKSTKFENVMDKWIVSFTNSLIASVRKEMSEYRLYTVVGPLTHYFETLTNSYIRLNRTRFKSDGEENDRLMALSALNHVLVQIVKLMAPFTPFFSEYLWRTLREFTGETDESVHFVMLPNPEVDLIDKTVERRVSAMLQAVELTRTIRNTKEISVRYPLSEVVVVNRNQQYLDDVKSLEPYVLSELNVKKLTISQDKSKYGVSLKAIPNAKLLGTRLKNDRTKVTKYLQEEATEEELENFIESGKITVHGYDLSAEEVEVVFTCSKTGAKSDESWEDHSKHQTVVLLNTHQDQALINEGLSREVTNRIQRMRKEANLHHIDEATAYCTFKPDGYLLQATQEYLDQIVRITGTEIQLKDPENGPAPRLTLTHNVQWSNKSMEEEFSVKLVVKE